MNSISLQKFGKQLYVKYSSPWFEDDSSSSSKYYNYTNFSILDDTKGSLQTTFKSDSQQYVDWGKTAKIGEKGEIYTIYTDRGKNQNYHLKATSKEGKVLWSKTFTEKDSSQGIAGMFMLKNKTLLVYIRLNTYKYNIYRFGQGTGFLL